MPEGVFVELAGGGDIDSSQGSTLDTNTRETSDRNYSAPALVVIGGISVSVFVMTAVDANGSNLSATSSRAKFVPRANVSTKGTAGIALETAV